MREKWEYQWANLELQTGLVGDPRNPRRETINERGNRGWELVSVVSNGEKGEDRMYVAFFKRPVREAAPE